MNARVYVQALYITKHGRTYRSQVRVVSEGQELFDFEQELKYQMAMKEYVIEFVNDRGHKQFLQPSDVETIIAAQLGYETPPPVAPVPEGDAKSSEWTDAEKEMIRKASGARVVVSVDPANENGVVASKLDEQGRFSVHLPFPKPPIQKVRVKPVDPEDGETTQEIPLPFAAPNAVARTVSQNDAQGPARTAVSQTIPVKLAAGTDPGAPTP